jgi:hypothetical protein
MGGPRPFGQLRRMVLAAGGVKRFLDIVPGVCRLVQVGVPCSPTACHVAAEAARATSPRKPCTDPAHPTRPLTKGPAPVGACVRLIQRHRADPQAVLLRGRARRSSARAVELRTPRHQRLLTAVLRRKWRLSDSYKGLALCDSLDDKGQPGHSVVRLVRRPPECGYCRSHQLAEDRLRTSRVIIPRIGGWCLTSAPRRCCWRSEPGVSSRSGSSSTSTGLIARRLQAR